MKKEIFFEFYGDEGSEGDGSQLEEIISNLEDDNNNNENFIKDFQWVDGEHLPEPDVFKPDQVQFMLSIVGTTADLTPFGCFSLFVNKKVIRKIVAKTNLYKKQQEDKVV